MSCVQPCVRGRSTGSFPEQRLVIEPNKFSEVLVPQIKVLFALEPLIEGRGFEKGGSWEVQVFTLYCSVDNKLGI